MTDKILFVDDEPHVVEAIQRQLYDRFSLQVALGGEEALRILKEEGPFAVIVSDMRMPKMNGIELLTQVKNFYPETVRLMLTGNTDIETAMQAVNTGQIFRFLIKPCPSSVLVTALAMAQRQHRLITAEKELLQKTLKGCVHVLSELLGIGNPLAFSSGLRIKDYVMNIAFSMKLANLWQYEIAALLSQIGCITLPGDILSKIYAGHSLTDEETEMYTNHPLAGAALLEKIPRLENVTKMIEWQQKRYDEYADSDISPQYEEVLIGAQLLKAVIDFDRLMFRCGGPEEATSEMRKQKGCYNPAILDLLKNISVTGRGQILSLNVSQICEGMVAAEDVLAKNNVLIIAKGQLISKSYLQGLKNFSKQVGVVEPIRVQVG
jgi:response regulator RpfG family c-di-GMP phosphodiesterase